MPRVTPNTASSLGLMVWQDQMNDAVSAAAPGGRPVVKRSADWAFEGYPSIVAASVSE
jgi:hypothetical protein